MGLAAAAAADALPRADATAAQSGTGELAGWTTGGDIRFQRIPPIQWRMASGPPAQGAIVVNPGNKFQEILGFGGALTDASCFLFSQLPEASRATLFHDLFHPSEMNLNVCRTCIGASDYSRSVYSFDG